MTLLWGGGVVPIASGLVLSSVPEGLQAFSFSLSISTYQVISLPSPSLPPSLSPSLSPSPLRDTCQVIGYGAGAFLPGLFIQQLEANGVAEIEALCWGWRLVLLWAGWGIIFLILALRSTMKNQKVDVKMTLPLSEVVVLVDHKFDTPPRATNGIVSGLQSWGCVAG
jgi:hypothetical protein